MLSQDQCSLVHLMRGIWQIQSPVDNLWLFINNKKEKKLVVIDMMTVSGVREILTWLDVPEKFVILHARTLYFGICSSIREKISTSSASELQRSNECTNRNCLLENPLKNLSFCILLFLIYADLFYEYYYHVLGTDYTIWLIKGLQIKDEGTEEEEKSDDLALTCHGRSIIILFWYVWQALWYSYAMLLKGSFHVGRKHR